MASFIIQNLEEILVEWESFARTVSPAAATMDSLALRDHAKQMLEAIAQDIATSQSNKQQALKSKGLGPVFHGAATAAASHGILRHAVGFDLQQLVAEFRALRATVLRLWIAKESYGDPESAYEMARFNEAVDQALAESVESYSKELSKSRDTFLGILGHDLRSPLSALANSLHLLSQARSDPGTAAEALEVGRRSVSAMSAMIGDLLEYTRTRLGKGIPVTPTPANLETVCKEAISEMAVVYPQTAFRFESGGTLDGTFDSARIRQLVSNLLNNAVHHGKRGAPVSLVARGEGDTLRLQVNNQGVPLSPDVLQVIFDPLVQIPSGASGRPASTNLGLGLFIAREIAVAHGGAIAAESSAEKGTTFSVELPCRNRAPGVAAPQAMAFSSRPA